jgi:hypothetical protein
MDSTYDISVLLEMLYNILEILSEIGGNAAALYIVFKTLNLLS